jgi:hypothetical protein
MKRRGRALRRRYGRAITGPQAITRPAGDGRYDVIVVNNRGEVLKTIARHVPYRYAKTIIRARHS